MTLQRKKSQEPGPPAGPPAKPGREEDLKKLGQESCVSAVSVGISHRFFMVKILLGKKWVKFGSGSRITMTKHGVQLWHSPVDF